MTNNLKLRGIIVESQQGGYMGYFSEFPEAVAEGDTTEEVKENMIIALNEVLAYKSEQNTSQEGVSSFELNLAIA